MYLSLPILVLLLCAILALGGALLAFLSSYIRMHDKARIHAQNAASLHRVQDAKHIVDLANTKAFQIVAQANQTAIEIVENARSLGEESKKLMDKEFKNLMSTQSADIQITGQKLLDVYESKLEEVKNSNIDLFRNISKSIEKNALHEVDDFKKVMEQETVEAQKIVGERIEEAYKEVETNVTGYRDTQMQEIDKKLAAITQEVVKETIGSSLTLKDHHELLLKALKAANLEGAIIHDPTT